MTTQLATLIGAHVPAGRGAHRARRPDREAEAQGRARRRSSERVNEGSSLADALAEHPRSSTTSTSRWCAPASAPAPSRGARAPRHYTEARSSCRARSSRRSCTRSCSDGRHAHPVGMFIGVIPRIRGLFDSSMPGGLAAAASRSCVFFAGDLLGQPPVGSVLDRSCWAALVAGVPCVGADHARARAVGQVPAAAPAVREAEPPRGGEPLLPHVRHPARLGRAILSALEIARDVVGNAVLATGRSGRREHHGGPVDRRPAQDTPASFRRSSPT